MPGRNAKWHRKFLEFPNFQKKGQPRKVNRHVAIVTLKFGIFLEVYHVCQDSIHIGSNGRGSRVTTSSNTRRVNNIEY